MSIIIENLNQEYKLLLPEERLEKFYHDFGSKKIIMTSAFNTTSVILLSLLNKLSIQQNIYFLNTGYHFSETINYKNQITEKYKLNVIDLQAETWKHQFTQDDQTYLKSPDFCCTINKTEPLSEVKKEAEFWVSGLMKWQNKFREKVAIFEEKDEIIKFHPIIDLKEKDAENYIKENNLLQHPLFYQGYASVGCTHCTNKGQKREGRWFGQSKTECGLHL